MFSDMETKYLITASYKKWRGDYEPLEQISYLFIYLLKVTRLARLYVWPFLFPFLSSIPPQSAGRECLG